MDYKVLYRKYRPTDFSNIIGQDYIVSILKNAISKNKISHAYIFSGPRGTGKTSTAKVFAKVVNCLEPTPLGPCNNCESCLNFKTNADIIEIDAASNNGVDEIREIINNIKLAPAYSKYKVYIIDEVHMLSTSAFNALLLTLEEPPKHVIFILATTNIEAVPITILSRCQRFDFHKITTKDILNRLNYIASNENIDIEPEALEEIAYISDGGMRDALSILDQLSSNTSKVTINDVISHFGSASKKQINDLFNNFLTNNIGNFVDMINNFKNLSIDYKLLIRKLLEKIEEEAINSKKDSNYTGLSYDSLRSMAFELADISNFININIDPFILIEITLLKYFPAQNEETLSKTKNLSSINNSNTPQNSPVTTPLTENSKPTSPPVSANVSKNLEKAETKPSKPHQVRQLDENLKELIKIRVNNCLCEASKENLKTIQPLWQKFLTNLPNKTLLNLIIDSNIVVASPTLAIVTDNIEGTVTLINKNLDTLSTEFNNFSKLSYKFVALTTESWQEEKTTYIANLKNKISYTLIPEPTIEETPLTPEINEFEKTAYEIFDQDKIEII